MAVLTAFGLLTLFMSGSVIFDLFDIRARQGDYVLFIVWVNFVSGFLFLIAAVAFFKKKAWSYLPLMASLGILAVAFIVLLIYIERGGAYEAKTIAAMILRLSVSLACAVVVYCSTRKLQRPTVVYSAVIVLFSFGAIASGCSHRHGDERNHPPRSQRPCIITAQIAEQFQ